MTSLAFFHSGQHHHPQAHHHLPLPPGGDQVPKEDLNRIVERNIKSQNLNQKRKMG